MYRPSKYKKLAVITFVVFFVFIELFGLLFFLRPVKAAGIPVFVTGSAPDTTKEIKTTIGGMLLDAALGSLLHAATYFMRRLAYDTATYLATGGKGQGALIFEGDAGSYFEELGKSTAADAIDQIGKPFGLNLCQNADLDFPVFLKIGLRSLYVGDTEGGPKPSCDWQKLKLKDHWKTYTLQKGFSPEKAFTNALQFEDTDFGVTIGAMGKIDRMRAVAEKGAEISRLAGQGYKDLTELVTGDVITPAQMVKSESELVTNKGQSEMTMSQVAGVYGVSSLKLVPMAASVFLNTFMSQGLKTLQEKLLNMGSGGSGMNGDVAGLLSFESSGFQSNRQKANAIFSSILTMQIQQLNNYPILEELAACPDPPIKRGLNNCVIDMGFKNVLDQAKQGSPLTVREAIDKGFLVGSRPLISPKRIADNIDKDCYLKGYCYSNLQKLRRNRIISLGFEIAASLADPDKPEDTWTLKQVMDGFDDCHYDTNGKVIPDFKNFPFCHLIDPNWILKVPDTRCNAKVYSSNLVDTNSGMRSEECVDLPARLKTPLSSTDEDNYGYCTREKGVWNLGGDSCEAQYGTCTTFTSSKNGKTNSFLARTVDYGECNLSNIGCLAYSMEKKGGEWINSAQPNDLNYKKEGRNQTMFFNDKISTHICSPTDNGCTGFYLGVLKDGKYVNSYAEENLTYLKKAPDYLGCYDAKPGVDSLKIDWPETKPELKDIKIDWPETKPELKDIKPDARCSEFASVCLKEEVNCDSYTSVKEPEPLAVPAVVGEKNYCDESCVGYDTFKQTATNFAPAEFPLYFIPENGQSCPGIYDGCDEFTNVDAQAKGGESLEYYTDLKYCERPNGKNESVFYSWEGSKAEGYVLKTHKLRPLTAVESGYLKGLGLSLKAVDPFGDVFPEGSPAYASDNLDSLQINYNLCNKDGYNKLVNGGSPGFNGVASIDCRALYDKSGKVFYRLLKDTITISESCHPLRKTISYLYTDENIIGEGKCVDEKKGYWSDDPLDKKGKTAVCRRCTNGGFYENGACVYWAISQQGDAQICQPSAVGCREYKGNAGNNLKLIWQKDFTPSGDGVDALNTAKDGWSTNGKIMVAQEAVQVLGYSLQINASQAVYSSSTLEINKLYTLSFWTRGDSQKLSVYFRQDDEVIGDKFTFDQPHNQDINISVGAEWQEFKLGPVRFVGDEKKEVDLVFERVDGKGVYYLDNVRLSRVDDVYHLIKDSWKTTDGNNVPGVCYNSEETPTDPYPGEALGCKLYKEESTGENKPIIGFEKMCREEAVGCRAMFDTYNTPEETMTIYNSWCEPTETVKCECKPEPGSVGCYVDKIVVLYGESPKDSWIKKSTVIVPADTPANFPIYLTNRPAFQCSVNSKGCQEFGAETHVLPNTPDISDNAFDFSEVNPTFLNDPEKYVGSEGTLCRDDLVGCGEFKSENSLFYFKNPAFTGNSFCEYKLKSSVGDASFFGWFKKDVGKCAKDKTKLCRDNNDCGKDDSCEGQGAVPCYENYMLPGGEYGIWSNNTPVKYQGMVGLCPDDKNGCREFIDPADTSDLNPDGKSYYAIYNNKLTEKEKICGGQASLKEGCVLFNKTDEPNLVFDSVETYKASEKKEPDKYGFVAPKSTRKNDSNKILKVERDRECAEWLSCKGYLPVNDESADSGMRNACYALQLCQKGTNFSCSMEADVNNYAGKILDYNYYVKRDVSWSSGMDFTGYSIFNEMFPSNFSFVNDKDSYYLAYNSRIEECKNLKDGDQCGNLSGFCLNKKCVYPITGEYANKANKTNFKSLLSNRECRGYPKQDSPFSVSAIVKEWNGARPLTYAKDYENVKVCEFGQNCDCDYTEAGYGTNGIVSETRYFNTSILPIGICQGGDKDGQPAVSASDCGDLGSYLSMQKKQVNKGWRGYCIEKDISQRISASTGNNPSDFACLTWYPLEYVPDTEDLFSNDPTGKGYVPPANSGQAYCTEMIGFVDLSPKDSDIKCDLSNVLFNLKSPFNFNYCSKIEYDPDKAFDDEPDLGEVVEISKDTNFKQVQKETKELMDTYLNTRIDEVALDTQPYISRVDVAVGPVPAGGDYIGGQPGDAYTAIYKNSAPAEELRKKLAYWYGMTMSTQGREGKPYVTLFPDTTVNGEGAQGTWHLSGVASYNLYLETSADSGETEGSDTGILRHRPNKAERFIYKDMVRAISIVPLWASESGGDTAEQKQVPNIGQPLVIDLEKDYLSYPASANSDGFTQPEFINSGAGFWNRYWVLKTAHDSDSMTKTANDGYLLQWFAADPSGSVGTDKNNKADGFSAYSKTFVVNPLEPNAVDCSQTEFSDNSHFLAIEILFDKADGKFIGYRSRNCLRYDGEWGYATAIVFHLKPMCVEAVRVQKDDEKVFKNKAWTDRLWIGSEYKKVGETFKEDASFPFGSIQFDNNLNNYASWQSVYNNPGVDDAHAGRPMIHLSKFKNKEGEVEYFGGYSVENIPGNENLSSDITGINELFAKVFKIHTRMGKGFSDGNKLQSWSYSLPLNTENPPIGTKTDVAQDKGKPPYIYPAINCEGAGIDRKCSADIKNPNNFSINGASGTKANDLLLGKGQYTALAEFYAWANHDQMPIRRVMVNWKEYGDDGTIAGNMYGYYPNAKPFCGDGGLAFECKKNGSIFGLTCMTTDDCETGDTCEKSPKPRFGNQLNSSCVETPFLRVFNYTCNAKTVEYTMADFKSPATKLTTDFPGLTINWSSWYDLLKLKGYSDTAKLCVFRPGVQVLDNWGWCTGSCQVPDNDNLRKGCYDDLQPYDYCSGDKKEIGKYISFNNIIVVMP